jgi:hypothetical protein
MKTTKDLRTHSVERTGGLYLLATPTFVLSVVLLGINDFLLKPMFHNWVTGKLSDAAGLAAFALFACALWPARRFIIAVTITIGFVFWKSPLSQFVIECANAVLPFAVGRTVDYSDCLVLPIVWLLLADHSYSRPWPARKWLVSSFACLSVLLFCATSYIPRYAATRSATIPTPARSSVNLSEQSLQTLFDDVASRYQLHCLVCDSLSSGRLYAENGNPYEGVSLIGNFDPERMVLFFDVRAMVPPNTEKARIVDSLRNELENRLEKEFPNIALSETKHPKRKSSVQLGVKKKNSKLSCHAGENRGDYDRAVTVIGEAAAKHGMKTTTTHSETVHYSIGRLYGPRPWNRELVMEVSIADWPLVAIDIDCYSPSYQGLQQTLAHEVISRLKAEFGAHRAWIR